jgi:hypothetical protein
LFEQAGSESDSDCFSPCATAVERTRRIDRKRKSLGRSRSPNARRGTAKVIQHGGGPYARSGRAATPLSRAQSGRSTSASYGSRRACCALDQSVEYSSAIAGDGILFPRRSACGDHDRDHGSPEHHPRLPSGVSVEQCRRRIAKDGIDNHFCAPTGG